MKIDLSNTVTARVILSEDDISRLNSGQLILQITEAEADDVKPLYICVTKEIHD